MKRQDYWSLDSPALHVKATNQTGKTIVLAIPPVHYLLGSKGGTKELWVTEDGKVAWM